MPEGLITESLLKYFKEHPTFGSFLLYLIGTSIGIFYEGFLLAKFDIYVFHYTKTYEYFLFSLKAWPLTITIISCLLLIVFLSSRLLILSRFLKTLKL